MGLSKAEVKLRRLLISMPNQDNPRKLMHYVATAKELLLELTGDSAEQSLPSISSEKAKEYAQKIETIAEKINALEIPDMWETLKDVTGRPLDEPVVARKSREAGDVRYVHMSFQSSSPVLRKREVRSIDKRKVDTGKPHPVVKLETATHEVMGKHRELQENLTDEMVILAQQMKETSLRMERSLHDSEKVLDSTEQAVEHSLATTNRANIRATDLSSRSWTTGCFTWLLIFAMCCIFIFMIALIRIT